MGNYSITGLPTRRIGSVVPVGWDRFKGAAWDRVSAASAEVVKLREIARDARRTSDALEADRRNVEARDRQAVADALRAGKPDPGRPGLAAHDKAIEESRWQTGAAVTARDDAEKDFAVILKQEREELVSDANDAIARQKSRLLETFEVFVTESEVLAELRNIKLFVERAGGKAAPGGGPNLFLNLGSAKGVPFTLNEVITAVRAALVAEGSSTPMPDLNGADVPPDRDREEVAV